MIFFRILLALGAIALAGAIFWAVGADDRGLGPVLQEMFREPWSIVTLIDLYLGFFIGAALIAIFERRAWVAALWAVPIFFLGNVWTALWLILRAPELVRRLRRAD